MIMCTVPPVDKGYPYEFVSAEQLLSDFFDNVDRLINEVTKGKA